MKVLVHWPMSSFQGRGGAAYPQVVSNELQEPVQFATYYPVDSRTISTDKDDESRLDMGITDFKNQEWSSVDFTVDKIENALEGLVSHTANGSFMLKDGKDEVHVFLLRPQMVLMMNSTYEKTSVTLLENVLTVACAVFRRSFLFGSGCEYWIVPCCVSTHRCFNKSGQRVHAAFYAHSSW